jgi:hypothetical protein
MADMPFKLPDPSTPETRAAVDGLLEEMEKDSAPQASTSTAPEPTPSASAAPPPEVTNTLNSFVNSLFIFQIQPAAAVDDVQAKIDAAMTSLRGEFVGQFAAIMKMMDARLPK